MVAEQPRSTKELSELLRPAGVVAKSRDGYFVLYRLHPERIGQLGSALRRTLGLAGANAGAVPPLPVSVAGEANVGSGATA